MKFAKTLAVAAVAALPMIASAQLSANVSLTSNYKFRGQDQDIGRTSAFKPALQGGFDYAFANGFYIGNWNSSVDWAANNSLESDFYGGYKFPLGPLAADVGLLRYQYSGNSMVNTTEAYFGVGYGPFSAKYSHTVSDGYFGWGQPAGDGKGTGYLNLAIAQEIMPKLTLKASVGFTNFKTATGAEDYTDYSIGASYDLGDGFSLSGALVGANEKAFYGFVNKNRFVLTITKAM
ncbi:TorF family putative porin [Variovorax sp. VNK109]|jgi:uncharacterized protein (TIGR02001 family)|uniref:TorF family putative porin n=1 Tax=Variovorax sp. VNK109 TaxID=3400919 RepID=UPI003BFD9446